MRIDKLRPRWKKYSRYVIYTFFGLVVLFQLNLVVRNYIVRWSVATYRTFGLSSMHRSARFLMGETGASYISFLRSVVPDEMPIVKPENVGLYGEQSVLQFFLMPRGIPACPCEFHEGDFSGECEVCLTRKSHYVPSVGGFRPATVMVGEKRLVEFPGDSEWIHGVYVPMDADLSEPRSFEGISTQDSIRSLAVSLLAYVSATAGGFAIAGALLRGRYKWWSLAVAFPLGSGLITVLVFASAWLFQIPVGTPSYLGALAIVITTSFIVYRTGKTGFRPPASEERRPAPRPGWRKVVSLEGLILTSIVVVLVFSAGISIGRAYSTFDGIANWATKGYAIALEESVFAGARWGGHHLEYPQNLALQIGFFRLLDNDSLPGSKILYTLLFGSLIAGSLAYWRSVGIRKEVASLGALVLATTPMLFVHSTLGLANLPMSVYLVLGILITLAGIRQASKGMQLIGGLLVGLSAWTRLEAAVYSVIILIAIVVVAKLLRLGDPRPIWLLTPMLLIELPWLSFYFIHARGTGVAFATAEVLFEGSLLGGGSGIDILSLVVEHLKRQFLDSPRWGAIVQVSAAGVIIGSIRAVRARDSVFATKALVFALVLLIVVSLFFFIGASGSYDIVHWLDESFDRHLIPVYSLLLVLSVYGVGGTSNSTKPSSD